MGVSLIGVNDETNSRSVKDTRIVQASVCCLDSLQGLSRTKPLHLHRGKQQIAIGLPIKARFWNVPNARGPPRGRTLTALCREVTSALTPLCRCSRGEFLPPGQGEAPACLPVRDAGFNRHSAPRTVVNPHTVNLDPRRFESSRSSISRGWNSQVLRESPRHLDSEILGLRMPGMRIDRALPIWARVRAWSGAERRRRRLSGGTLRSGQWRAASCTAMRRTSWSAPRPVPRATKTASPRDDPERPCGDPESLRDDPESPRDVLRSRETSLLPPP